MSDLEISCSDCGTTFPFRETEQAFYRERNLTPPKRCRACRDARKTSGGPGERDRAPRPSFPGGGRTGGPPGGPRHDSGPHGAGDGERPRFDARRGGPPGRGGPPARDDRFRSPTDSARGPARAFSPRARPGTEGARGGGGPAYAPREATRAPARGGAAGEGGAARWGRPEPAFGKDGAPVPGGSAAERRAHDPRDRKRDAPGGHGGPRPANREHGRDAGSGNDTRAGGDKSARPKADKPRFTIKCEECSATSDVPFKPLEGRPVFCQPCYRARKGTTAQATEGVAIEESDVGIVE